MIRRTFLRFALCLVLVLAVPSGLWAATLYWFGGSNNWSNLGSWSNNSGNVPSSPAAALPTSVDDVVFDVNSHSASYTVTVDAAANCRDMTWANPASGSPTLAGSSELNVYGNIVLVSGMTKSHTGWISFFKSGGTQTVATNGVIFNGDFRLQNTSTVQLLDDLHIQSSGLLTRETSGPLDANGKTVYLSGGLARIRDNSGYGITFYNLVVTGIATKTDTFTINNGNITVTNNLTITGNSAINRVLVASNTIGTARTITVDPTKFTGGNFDLRDINFATAGANLDLSALAGTVGGGVMSGVTISGGGTITFTPAVTQYYYKASGNDNWSTAGNWYLATAGGGGAGRVPLMQDTARFDSGSFGAASMTVTQDMPRIGSVDWTGATNTPTWTTSTAASVFGSVTLITGMTLTASTQAYTFEGRGSYTLTSAGKTWGKPLTINAPGGTLTLLDAFIGNSYGAIGVSTFGTLDLGGYNYTGGGFSTTSVATSIAIISSSTITLFTATGVHFGNVLAIGGSSSLTATGSTIKLTDATAATKTMALGGKTYGNLWLAPGAGVGTFAVSGVNNNTFNDFKDDGTAAHSVLFTAATTTTVATFTISGGSAGNLKTIGSITAANHTLTKTGGGRIDVDYCTIQRSTATPANTWYYGANSTKDENTTGWNAASRGSLIGIIAQQSERRQLW